LSLVASECADGYTAQSAEEKEEEKKEKVVRRG
jgi:hypothetical protein